MQKRWVYYRKNGENPNVNNLRKKKENQKK